VNRILVTGGAGFIGSALVRHLVATGVRIVNLDRLTYAGNLASLAPVESAPNYRFVRGDIADGARILSLLREERIEGIMHLAAESHVDRSIDGPAAFVETNVLGTFRLLSAALACIHLDVRGLMTVPPYDEDPERSRPYFAALRELRDRLARSSGRPLPELSMGMSHDFAVAVEEGATEIRVGTALFGAREAP